MGHIQEGGAPPQVSGSSEGGWPWICVCTRVCQGNGAHLSSQLTPPLAQGPVWGLLIPLPELTPNLRATSPPVSQQSSTSVGLTSSVTFFWTFLVKNVKTPNLLPEGAYQPRPPPCTPSLCIPLTLSVL